MRSRTRSVVSSRTVRRAARGRTPALAACLISVALHSACEAATQAWTAVSGSFGSAPNWNSGSGPVPGAADTALFSPDGKSHTVDFDFSPTNSSFSLGSTNSATAYIFRASSTGSRTYTLTGPTTLSAGARLTLDPSVTGSRSLNLDFRDTLTFTGGRVTVNAGNRITSAASLNLTTENFDSAILEITGAGAALAVAGSVSLTGRGGAASLTVQNGAQASFDSLTLRSSQGAFSSPAVNVRSGARVTGVSSVAVGAEPGAVFGSFTTSSLNVTGSGSAFTMTATGAATIGSAQGGPGTLAVEDAGAFTGGTGDFSVGPRGNVNLAGGTLNLNGDIVVSGGAFTHSAGAFNWAASRSMTIQQGGRVSLLGNFAMPTDATFYVVGAGSQLSGFAASDLEINSNALIILNSGATLSSGGYLDINHGNVVVDGSGSTITVASAENYLGFGAAASLTIRGNAIGNLGGLYLGINGGQGKLDVQPGSTVTLGSTRIATEAVTGSSGKITLTGGTLTQPGDAYLLIGAASGSVALLDLKGGTFTAGTGGITLDPTGVLNISGGTLNAPAGITRSGGTFTYNFGTLNLGGNLTVGTAGLLGPGDLNLTPNRTVSASGTATIDPGRSLTINGGTFSSGSISNSGSFAFNTGTLGITGPSGFNIGPAGPLGSTLSLQTGKNLNVSALTTLSAAGTLTFSGGTLTATGGITNSGEIRLAGPSALITGGTLDNRGLLRGDGRIESAELRNAVNSEVRVEFGKTLVFAGAAGRTNTNSGSINLLGGTVQFTRPLVNTATGTLAGTGAVRVDAGLTSNGLIQLSAGTSDLYGPITTSSRFLLSPSASANLYGNLTLAPGSELQISINSAAHFFGAVTGSGTFSGPGTKDFAGAAPSSLTRIATRTGSTRVAPAASLTVGSIDEAALLVEGALTLTSSQLPSRTISLSLGPAGRLDVNASFLLLDYAPTDPSPLATIRAYLAAGRNNGAWNGPGLSSAAARALNTAAGRELGSLAILDNAANDYATFQGLPTDASSLLIRFTYTGDTNLDGRLDGRDLATFLEGYTRGLTGWQNGDFNYDGIINTADYSLLTAALAANPPPLPGVAGEGTSPSGAVPEPAAALALLPTAALLPRRRR